MDHRLKQMSWKAALLRESRDFGSLDTESSSESSSGSAARGRVLPCPQGAGGEGRREVLGSFTVRLGCEKSLENGQEMGHPVSDVRLSAVW